MIGLVSSDKPQLSRRAFSFVQATAMSILPLCYNMTTSSYLTSFYWTASETSLTDFVFSVVWRPHRRIKRQLNPNYYITLPLDMYAVLPAQKLPVFQILSTVDSLPHSRLTRWTFTRTVSSELRRFLGEPLQVTVRPMLRNRCPMPCVSSLYRWCTVAKRLDGSRCHFVRR